MLEPHAFFRLRTTNSASFFSPYHSWSLLPCILLYRRYLPH